MSINTNLYTAGNSYYQTPLSESLLGSSDSKTAEKKETASSLNSGDRVTLSKGVVEARTREALGLMPTGPLKLDHFKDAAEAQEKEIESGLKKHMKTLGIDKDQTISISLDKNADITIKESFPGKKELVKALNKDKEFKLDYKRLSANRETIDYVESLQTGTAKNLSMVDFMSEGTGYDSLHALAARYQQIRYSENSLQTILGMSHEASPFTYVHGEE